MNSTCPRCNTVNLGDARFCQCCGTSLAATMVQQRTVVMQPTQILGAVPPASRPGTHGISTNGSHSGYGAALGCTQAATASVDQHEDTMLVTDYSGSMGEEFQVGMTKLDTAARSQINLVLHKHRIDPNDRIGLVGFNDRARLLLPLSEIGPNKAQMIQILQAMRVSGGTEIKEGLVEARDGFDWMRSDVVRRIVLLTDGHGGHPLRVAEALKSKGVVIDVIGIGPSPDTVDEALLKKVASIVQGELHYWFIKNHRALVDRYTQLANKTKTGP
jgi:Mg-chelatase subunit ChlD